MSDPRPKLPRSIIVLNVAAVLLILLVCGLAFYIGYSALKEEQEASTSSFVYIDTEEAEEERAVSLPSASDVAAAVATNSVSASTSTKASVSMTKRTTDATEPVSIPTTASSDSSEPTVSSSYSKDFFADDLFIGDSISTGLYLYGKLDEKNVAAEIGYTPYKAYTEEIELADGLTMTALDYAASMQPKRIFIMLGSNGMTSDSDIEAMKDTYRTLIEKLVTACPESIVCCIAVSPVTADSSAAASGGITNEIISDFNAYVQSMCGELGVEYFDLYSLLLDESGYLSAEYAEIDGLHFLSHAYDVMLAGIEAAIGE